MKFKQNKKNIFLGSTIFLVILAMTLFSYGYLMTKTYGNSGSKKTSFKSQLLSIKFSDGSESLINSSGDYFIPGATITKTFSITNTGNVSSKFSINLKDVTNGFKRIQDLAYELKKEDEVISSGTFPNTDISLVTKLEINSNETQNYTLIINYLTSEENQIEDSGKVINANIVLDQNIKIFSKLEIYGNTIVDGTPSIATPSTIKSLGESSKNLFDISKVSNTGEITNNKDGTLTIKGGNYACSTYKTLSYLAPSLKEGDIVKLTAKTTGSATFIYLLKDKKTWAFDTTKTITQNMLDSIVYFYNTYTTKPDYASNHVVSKIQLQKIESTETEYRPYKYIDVNIKGKNLFNSAWYRSSYTSSGLTWIKNGDKLIANGTQINSYLSAFPITQTNDQKTILVNSLQIGHTYKMVGQPSLKITGVRTYVFANILRNGTNKYYSSDTSPIFTYLEGDNITFDLRIYSNDGIYKTLNNVEFRPALLDITNDSSEAFEPYQEPKTITIDLTGHEPLRKIGDIADYIDYKNKKIVRNIGKVVLNGTENVKQSSISVSGYAGFYIDYILTNKPQINNVPLICNYFKQKTFADWSNGLQESFIENTTLSVGFRIENNIASTVSEFKNWLANNSVEIYYPLATPIEEDLDIPNLKALEFTNNITACDELMCSSNIEAEYDT